MYYPIRTPQWIQYLFPKYLWRMPLVEGKKKLYLTFDDGPIPGITPWVLEQLRSYNAQATFFCVGANVKKNPTIFQQIVDENHQIGNHTFSHLNAWKTSKNIYLEDVKSCQKLTQTNLFRPPYGRLLPFLSKALMKDYQIVMWEVIAGDFDPSITGDKCLANILNHAKDGSIIVLHDSKKSWERLEYVLPLLLEHYTKLGFVFEALP